MAILIKQDRSLVEVPTLQHIDEGFITGQKLTLDKVRKLINARTIEFVKFSYDHSHVLLVDEDGKFKDYNMINFIASMMKFGTNIGVSNSIFGDVVYASYEELDLD